MATLKGAGVHAILRVCGALAALACLAGLITVLAVWRHGEAHAPPAVRIDRDGDFQSQVDALGENVQMLERAFPGARWLNVWPGQGHYAPGYPPRDRGELERAAQAVAAFPSDFAGAALIFAVACGLGLLGGVLWVMHRPRMGGTLLLAAFGVTLSLSSHLVPPVLYPMAVAGLLGLLAFFTAPRVRLPAQAGERQRVQSAIGVLAGRGNLIFERTDAFYMNVALGSIVLVPGVLYWLRGRSYVRELGAVEVVTQAGQRHQWVDLARVSKRSFRRRGWYIGHRLIKLEFTTGAATLEEIALAGPFDAVWNALGNE